MINHYISFNSILSLFSQFIWVIAFFFILRKLANRLVKKESLQKKLTFYIPLLRNITLVILGIKTLYVLGLQNPVLVLFISGVLIALTWTITRDFILGIAFKILRGDIVGQQLKVTNHSGRIVRMGEVKISIISENGEIVQIPYHQLFTGVIIKPFSDPKVKTQTILLPITHHKNIKSLSHKIKKHLLLMPWIITKNGVEIDVITQHTSPTAANLKISYTIDASSNMENIEIETKLKNMILKEA